MATLTIRLPDGKHARPRQPAQQRKISLKNLLEELTTMALTEFDAETRFRARAAHGSAAEGLRLLDKLDAADVNYDLPWNPQRIEQRISRCHRYGQEHNVVVVNFLTVAAPADNGQPLDADQASRLLRLPAWVSHTTNTLPTSESLVSITACQQEAILQSISQRNASFFEVEANKLDGWAEDLKVGLEREIKELDRQIRETRRAATAAPTLQEKLEAQKHVKSLETHRHTRRRALFDAQDDIRVHLDLWYAVSPMKGGHSHGQFAVSRHRNPPDRGARLDQSHGG